MSQEDRKDVDGVKGVFVTVGTTEFDDLIRASTTNEFYQLLVEQGYEKLTIQIGRGCYTPSAPPSTSNLEVSWYRYKDSLQPDMQAASLIISHGGVGCIMEALTLAKPLVVVINQALMDNHQTELAQELSSRGHLLYTTHKELHGVVEKLPSVQLVKYEPGDTLKLGKEIDRIMGFT